MALVNPNIAMSYRPATEYQPRNALAEYAQVQQIVGGQQAQELNALKMREAQAGLEERNALSRLNPADPDYENQLFKVSPQLGIQFRKEAATTAAQRAAQQKSEFELTTARRKFAEDLKRGLSANPSDENIVAFGQDALLQNLYTEDQVKSEVGRLLALPITDRVRILSQAGASAADLRPQVISGQLVSGGGNVLYTAPSALGAVEAEVDALRKQGVADNDPRIVNRLGKLRQLSGTPGPTEIAVVEAEVDALRKQGVVDNDPRIVARQNKIAQLSGAGTPRVDVIGVAEGTRTPVYFDERAGQQFTIGTDPSGKQTRVPYVGGVNRATSSVTATATSTTSPTGKSLAAPVGARAETSLAKAEGASGIMDSANMVREALNAGNVIAGPLAGVRTKFAQVLELAGAGDKEKLVNTRTAIQGLATLTLESRAELKGQGQVTENEQKLLERARSGNVEDMTIAELQQVVNVSQRLANRLWSSHQTLLKTMETDPAAADSIRYYRPTTVLPPAVGEGRPQAETEKRKQDLGKIFGRQQPGK